MTMDVEQHDDELDQVLDLLSCSLRREVLAALQEADPVDAEGVSLADIVPDGATEPPMSLHHVHLPKLEHAGLVEWDDEAEVIGPGARFEEVEPLVELLRRNEDDLPGAF